MFELYRRFRRAYRRGSPPWDNAEVPPEILELVAEVPPGLAIDLGCGTGTTSIALAQHGWAVLGLDFIGKAIRQARRRARQAQPPGDIEFHVRDVRNPPSGPFDLAVDIGCGHAFSREGFAAYVGRIADLLRPGGIFMLYAHHPEAQGPPRGKPDAFIREAAAPHFDLLRHQQGGDPVTGGASSWYRFSRKAPPR
ncbi:MAG: methyltransferase domain-containing protein [Anaerolineae bacterium]